jgi:ABC-type uncharacterized transport system substrate-binding protein
MFWTGHKQSPFIRTVRSVACRSLIILAVAILTGWSASNAQQPWPAVFKVGFLRIFSCADQLLFADFRRGLRDLGYIDGQNLTILCRAAPGAAERLPVIAAELARLNVDVLVAEGTQATLAAMKATKTIPIVMVYPADPVASHLIESLARPGGNVTGVSVNLTEVAWKNVEILKEVSPRISRIALLTDSTQSGHMLVAEQLDAAARALGVRMQRIDILTPAALDGAFDAILSQRAQALIVQPLFITPSDVHRIVKFAIKNRLPTMTFHTPYVRAGLLMLYGPNVPDHYRRAANYVDKILRGAKPGDLPVEQPTNYNLVINKKAARALHLKLPEALVQRADEVIN